jgi:hypothetical protein
MVVQKWRILRSSGAEPTLNIPSFAAGAACQAPPGHVGLALPSFGTASGTSGWSGCLSLASTSTKGGYMPIIAWLLGVPISVIILLMLFGVF